MHFHSTVLSKAALVLSLGLVQVGLFAKADVIGFSGNMCDGDGGVNVGCDNSCILFNPPQRHSIQVLATGFHCLTLFQNRDCTGNVGQLLNPGNTTCTTVNTGITVGSFKCSPNATCSA